MTRIETESSRIAAAFRISQWQFTSSAPQGVRQSDDLIYCVGVVDGDTVTWVLDREGNLQSVRVNGAWLIYRAIATRNECALMPGSSAPQKYIILAERFLEESKSLFAQWRKEKRANNKSKEVTVCDVALNERQQNFLRIIFEWDQEAEAEQKERWHQGRTRQSASVWRWMTYNPLDSVGLIRDFRSAKLVDKGTGATFKSLAEKGLVELREPYHLRRVEFIIELKLTTKGRKVCRQLFPDFQVE